MRAAGSSPELRLSFDLMVQGFGERYEQAQQATREEAAPKTKRSRNVRLVPKHSETELLGFLGLDEMVADLDEGSPEMDAMVQALLRGEIDPLTWGQDSDEE